MTEPSVTGVLPNGLSVRLISAPQLPAASACLHCASGSFSGPERWPGLAHLLEHLLFHGGKKWPGEQRLMPWITARQGRVNATTGLCQTLYYFDCAVTDLPGGIERLLDMVSDPLFSADTVRREIAVIDAEYQMLSRHTPTLLTAVMHASVSEPALYGRFIAGNRDSLSGDLPGLVQALHDFHRQHYHPDNLSLTVRAPLPLAELQQLVPMVAELTGHQLRPFSKAATAPAAYPFPLRPEPSSRLLQLPGEGHHCLESVIADPSGELLAAVPLLQALLSDAAPGSLHHYWSQRGYCRQLGLDVVSTVPGSLWLRVHLQRPSPAPQAAGQLTADWLLWLEQLTMLSAGQIAHYQQLALQHFGRLSPMEQLRQLESGLGQFDQPVRALATALLQQPPDELQTTVQLRAESVLACGFRCITACSPLPTATISQQQQGFVFYPQTVSPPQIITDCCSLLPDEWQYLPVASTAIRIMMRPVQGTTLTPAQLLLLEQSLQPLFSRVRHAAGEASITDVHGLPWVVISLPDAGDAIDICRWLAALWPADFSAARQPGQQIVIRRLLAEFPAMLAQTLAQPRWSGFIQCQDHRLFRQLSDILRQTLRVEAPAACRQMPRSVDSRHHLPQQEEDNALLYFLPLPDQMRDGRAAARAMVSLCQPLFYHWLREELSAGYVVDCRYQQYGETAGMLFLLQSPDYDCRQLALWCRQFLPRIRSQIVGLTEIPPLATLPPLHNNPLVLQAMQQSDPSLSAAHPAPADIGQIQALYHYWVSHNDEVLQLSCGRWPE